TYLAKKGIVLDPAMAEYVAGFFALLLLGQAATDHGKEKTKIEAARDMAVINSPAAKAMKDEGGFIRLEALGFLMIATFIITGAALTACSWLKSETKHVAA